MSSVEQRSARAALLNVALLLVAPVVAAGLLHVGQESRNAALHGGKDDTNTESDRQKEPRTRV